MNMYKLTNILNQRNGVVLKLKNIKTNKTLKLILSKYHYLPYINEILEYTFDRQMEDLYNDIIDMYSLHNDRINLNFYYYNDSNKPLLF